MSAPRVELVLTDAESGRAIRNLWPLYVHDLSPYTGQRPNPHGVLIDDPAVADLAAQGETQRGWWQDRTALFPYRIDVDGELAGFSLVARTPFTPEGRDVDNVVHEFFLLQSYRGRGIAETAALASFASHRGRWEVVTDPPNVRAVRFWRRVIDRASGGVFTEEELDHPWGRKVAFTFETA